MDPSSIRCPALFLLGENEAEELKRQTEELQAALKDQGSNVTVRVFSAEEGADAHCQLNNLRLAHQVIFGWLDQVLDREEEAGALDRRVL